MDTDTILTDGIIQIIGSDIIKEMDNFRNNRNISYNIGRRGSNGIIVTPNGSSRGNGNNIISNPNIRISRGNDVIRPETMVILNQIQMM